MKDESSESKKVKDPKNRAENCREVWDSSQFCKSYLYSKKNLNSSIYTPLLYLITLCSSLDFKWFGKSVLSKT